jgi:DNA processing protein
MPSNSPSLPADELLAWLRLAHSPGLGLAAARRLLAAFGSPQQAVAAGAATLRELAGSDGAQALLEPVLDHPALLQSTTAWLADDAQRRFVVTLGDPAYPRALLETADPPLLLYVQGRLSLLGEPSLAMVGSRHATPGGLDNAHAFARHLSGAGLVIVSGLALGIDGAAHAGALDGATALSGGTIAVVGTGLDRVYPKRHHALAHRMSEGAGLMLSEFPLGTPPLPLHFPKRNRIIAGLSLGTLVVEAAVQSGSLITARMAVECGREVFAIPGSIHSPQSRGCHRLIKDGAKLVETADDILQELRWQAAPAAASASQAPSLPEGEDPLLAALGHDPVTLDALVARTGWPAADLQARLLALELDGHLARLPGGMVQRRARA